MGHAAGQQARRGVAGVWPYVRGRERRITGKACGAAAALGWGRTAAAAWAYRTCLVRPCVCASLCLPPNALPPPLGPCSMCPPPPSPRCGAGGRRSRKPSRSALLAGARSVWRLSRSLAELPIKAVVRSSCHHRPLCMRAWVCRGAQQLAPLAPGACVRARLGVWLLVPDEEGQEGQPAAAAA